jgi:fumarate hydratase class II
MAVRPETDAMGDVDVPAEALYGASTGRAVENFQISRLKFSRKLIWAHATIKSEAARTNRELGIIPADVSEAIVAAAGRVASGELDDHFPLDLFQTGSGTSTNMNMNEVVANLASEAMGGALGSKRVHPNDHVNACQSSNDTIPTAIHIAVADVLKNELIPALDRLAGSLAARAVEFVPIVKIARTHLIDAPPIRMGQVFGGFATQIRKSKERVERVLPEMYELPLGSTVNGTGINAHPEFAHLTIEKIAVKTGLPFFEAEDHFEALGAKDGAAMTSAALETVAVSLHKVANDIRWLSSGPAGGLGELLLTPLQPGSSIIPGLGKVNPVICEAVMQVVAQVVGNHASVVWGVANGNFELNTMAPVIGHNLLESAELLATSCSALSEKVIENNLRVDEDECRRVLERNVSVVIRLTPRVGYDVAASVAREAIESGEPVRAVLTNRQLLSETEIDEILDLADMTRGGRFE